MGKQDGSRIFDFDSYKKFLQSVAVSKGRGFFRELASYLRVHSSLVSQMARGAKHPTEEQACSIAEHLGLGSAETEFFLMLVLRERAGNAAMRRFVDGKIKTLQLEADKPSSRVSPSGVLSDSDKAEFYSYWYYSAVRLMTSIKGFQSAKPIADRLGLPLELVDRTLKFLAGRGLCKKESGDYFLGVSRTHEPSDSPHILRHHLNWRMKAMERLPSLGPTRLAFTCPFTASAEDEAKLRRCLSNFIAEFNEIVDRSPCEKLFCLNVDWFDVSVDGT